MHIARIVVASSLLLASSACKRAESRTGSGAGGSGAESRAEALGEKTDPYIVCLNTFSRDVFQGRNSYLDSFDAEKGPVDKDLKKGRLYGPRKLQDPKACLEGVAAAAKREPRLPKLEAAGQAYVAALQKLIPIYQELDTYFDREDYKDDALAKVKGRHAELMAAWKAFGEADHALGEEVDAAEDQVQVAKLAELEKSEGKKLRWLHTRLIATAKKVLRAGGLASDPSQVDAAKLQAAVGEYETHLSELKAYTTAHKEEVDNQVMAYWRIDSPAEEVLKTGKAVMRRARDKVKFSSGERMTIEANNAESVDGHPASLIRAYNSLIEASNGMSFKVMQ